MVCSLHCLSRSELGFQHPPNSLQQPATPAAEDLLLKSLAKVPSSGGVCCLLTELLKEGVVSRLTDLTKNTFAPIKGSLPMADIP